MRSPKRILVPTDYSECSRDALQYALRLAERLGAAVDVVHVWSAPFFGPNYEDIPVGKEGKSLYTLIRERAGEEMAEFLKKVTVPVGVTLTHHIESGEPTQCILELIQQRAVDMIVMGTHGRTGPKYWLLGSVAARTVQLSPRPVLTVPPKAAA